MILRTLDRARGCRLLDEIWVATDCEDIRKVVEDDGGHAVMTSKHCKTGTDRIVEALKTKGYTQSDAGHSFPWGAIVNIQGDEPLLPSSNIDMCLEHFFAEEKTSNVDIATLVTPIRTLEDFQDKNIVKCVVDESDYALYFSRAQIPYHVSNTSGQALDALRHIGIYVYRPERLYEFIHLKSRHLERLESLEQLRALEANWRIKTIKIEEHDSPGIDTPEQLEDIERRFFPGH
jgi:3-deoxy-manno-octulosonate cytidylyltransferase (CMP-KDO synthetase)|eukprot:g8901.t1